VDRQLGEVRIPAWFVNPSRKLEVFACHESGPTHETVVAFRAEGEEIDRALRQAGFRGPEFWNATSPRDLELTGGDRAVAWIRWEWKGVAHEFPAEEILIEEGTGLPLFVRGFSFASRPVELGNPPRLAIPKAVEITIGGATRQSASFSMLDHPNDLPEMVNWEPAPEVNPRVVEDLAALVESRAPSLVIIRRVQSESVLVELALGRESDPLRRKVRESQRPVAAAIDRTKGEFERLVSEVRRLLEDGERRKEIPAEERRLYAARTRDLLARGALLAAQLREDYLRLWSFEEDCRLAQAELSARLEPEQRAWMRMAVGSGFRFEISMAEKRREIAALFVPEAGKSAPALGPDPVPPGDGTGSARSGAAAGEGRERLLARALESEIRALEFERERRWAGFKLEEEIRPRLKSLNPKEDAYTRELFQESEVRALGDMRSLRARAEAAEADAQELRAQAAGSLAALAPELARRRSLIDLRGRLAAEELAWVDCLEKVRWAQNPPGGVAEPSAKDLSRLKSEEAALLEKIRGLKKGLEKASGGPAGSGEEPPEGWPGAPLYPAPLQEKGR
jgi:hypothetical protein